jgi:hypothetical protein
MTTRPTLLDVTSALLEGVPGYCENDGQQRDPGRRSPRLDVIEELMVSIDRLGEPAPLPAVGNLPAALKVATRHNRAVGFLG